jgi:hypothetical protein
MKRKIIIGVLVVVVVAVVVLVLVASNLDKIIKIGVEKGGTLVLGVPTTLQGVTVKVREGTVGLDGLKLGSPEGFSAPSMFELGHAHTTVDLGSLRTDEMVIHEVVIDKPEITLEFAGAKTNWGTVLAKLDSGPKEAEAKKESQKKVRVDRIVFSNGKVRFAGVPGAGSVPVPLPTLEITDLAPAEGGAQTVGGVLADVIRSLNKSLLDVARKSLSPEQLQKLGGAALGAVGSAAGSAADVGAAAGGAAAGAAKDVGSKATGLLRGVLSGGKDKNAGE